MDDPDWTELDALLRDLLSRHDGVVKLSTLIAAGISGKQAGALLGRGLVDRPRSGWYVDPALPWEAKHAIRVGGVLDCVSAVDSFGLPVPLEAKRLLHVIVPANSARRRHHRSKRRYVVPGEDREVVLHWSSEPGTPAGWRVPLVDALLQLADCVPVDWWIAALDAARHRPRGGEPLLADEEWKDLARRVPARLRPELRLVDPRSERVIESLLRLALIRRGIPLVDLQFWPDQHHRVDILLPGRLILEADGAAWHDPLADAGRDAFLRGLGYRVLHFDYDRIVNHIDDVVLEILEALADEPTPL
ncbi:DUF559 domain-containing protein [uncultured Amnibacterium sp.]|uniref:DUF559 domain-containing protein n=1 Tax=uncultured Amnibacterium sp. TaxID=1631851 RepID=UPI0035CB895C